MRWPASRPELRVETIVALVALYCVLVGNGNWWGAIAVHHPMKAASSWLFLVCVGVALVALHFILLVLPATRWTVKPWLGLIIIATAFAAYYMRTFNVLLDASMLRNVLRTDRREAAELMSWSLAWQVMAWSALPLAFIAWVRPLRTPVLRAALFRVGAILIALLIAIAALLPANRDFTSLMRNQRELRYMVTPGNYIVSFITVASADARTAARPREVVGDDARRDPAPATGARPRVFVYVVGETARGANFSLNGYARETNPELSQLDIVNFPNVTACGTSTEVSLPCMFSPWGRADYDEDRIRGAEGLLHVLVRAGYAATWYENQSGCKGVCEGAGIRSVKLDGRFAPAFCRGEECDDRILVDALLRELDTQPAAAGDPARDRVIVLHMMGNHGPAYYRRYPEAFRRFTPDCQTAELRECSREEVVNAFDNDILYTDHLLASLIRALSERSDRLDTALLYVSDHGESLGESGLYLHGVPYALSPRVQTWVPMIYWQSTGFGASAGLDAQCMKQRASAPASHDNLFHSMLGLLDVRTSAYLSERDLFAPCRRAQRAVLAR
jgi:lipid A ethanolaminephosphotransferase